jgi:hypothetical protein
MTKIGLRILPTLTIKNDIKNNSREIPPRESHSYWNK